MADTGPLDPDWEARYGADPDPFGVFTSWYERRKQACLEAVLSQEHYATAWDAACGVGQVTMALARRSDQVVASDLSPVAVRLTREATSTDPHVTCLVNVLPQVPAVAGSAELVVLSEVLYYLSDDDRRTAARAFSALPDVQEIVAVSWRHRAADTRLSGAESLAELGDHLVRTSWKEHACLQDPDFEIRSWLRP